MAPKLLILKRASQLEAVTHPLRLEILERLQTDRPDSIAGLARELDRKANGLAYHVRLLEKEGILKRVGERRTGRRPEAIYAPAAERMALAASPKSPALLRAAVRSSAAVLRMTQREVRRALEGHLVGMSDRVSRPMGRRLKSWLTDADLIWVHRRLEEIDRYLEKCHRRKKGRSYSLTTYLVPIGPERK